MRSLIVNVALYRSPVCKWGSAVHRARAPFSQESPWGRPRNSLAASAQQGRLLFGSRRGHFPFPREKGSEKGSYETLAGVGRKPDFLQKSCLKSGWGGRPRQWPRWHFVAPSGRPRDMRGRRQVRTTVLKRVCDGRALGGSSKKQGRLAGQARPLQKMGRGYLAGMSRVSQPL